MALNRAALIASTALFTIWAAPLWAENATPHAPVVSPNGAFTITAFGENLTDRHYFIEKNQTPLAGVFGGNNPLTGSTIMRGFEVAPLTFGVKLDAKF